MRLNAKNNAETILTQAVGISDTLIHVEDANLLPDVPFMLTFDKSEIVKVTEKDGNILTVERAQEGTIAGGYPVGTKMRSHFTAGMYYGLMDVTSEQVNYRADLDENSLPSEFPVGITLCKHKTYSNVYVTYRLPTTPVVRQIDVSSFYSSIRIGDANEDIWQAFTQIGGNYASTKEAEQANRSDRKMSPQNTRQAIESLVPPMLENFAPLYIQEDEPDLTPEELERGGQFWLKKVDE